MHKHGVQYFDSTRTAPGTFPCTAFAFIPTFLGMSWLTVSGCEYISGTETWSVFGDWEDVHSLCSSFMATTVFCIKCQTLLWSVQLVLMFPSIVKLEMNGDSSETEHVLLIMAVHYIYRQQYLITMISKNNLWLVS